MHKRRLSLALVCLAPLLLGACQNPFPAAKPKLTGSGMDMFTPVKARLHPLSRVVPEGANPLVEARVEFTDQFGDVGKGVGKLQFYLYAFNSLTFRNRGRILGHWSMDLATPTENRDHWDPITRTYLFKLPLQPNALADNSKVILTTTITLPNGERLSDDLTLPVVAK